VSSRTALGALTVGQDDDPQEIWQKIRALAAAGGLPPMAAVRLALAATDLVGRPHEHAVVEVAEVCDRDGTRVEAVVTGGSGRCDGMAARLANACHQTGTASGEPAMVAVIRPDTAGNDRAAEALLPDALLAEAGESGGLPELLAATLVALDEEAARAAGYRTELGGLRAELDATSQGLLALHAELTQREEQLDQARAAAELAAEAKAAFLARVSHEIRSPLHTIAGFTTLLKETELTGEQAEYTGTLAVAAGHLKDLVNGVLDLSRAESGQLELEEIPFDLTACVEEAAGLLAPQAEEKDVALAVLLAPDTPQTVAGDPLRLRQILVNLLSNAVKFTSHGHVTIEVAARPAADEGDWRLVFDVRDTGPGIPADTLDRLFEPFIQADSSITRRFGGTGLGLAICRQLTDRMGGQITVESAPGQGAIFTAEVTLRQVPQADQGREPDRPLSGVHVLLVHPQHVVAEAARRHLAAWGAAATVVASCEAAAGRSAEWADAALAVVASGRDPADLPGAIQALTAARGGQPLPVVGLTPLTWHRPTSPPFPTAWTVRQTPIRGTYLREAVLGALGRQDPGRAGASAAPQGPAVR
jgi:signal transduction histidine kinase